MANEQMPAAVRAAQPRSSEPVRPHDEEVAVVIGSETQPGVQTLMVDKRNDQVGVVMGHEGPYVQLRPPQGGKEWDVPAEELRLPTQAEEIRAKVAVANGRWGL